MTDPRRIYTGLSQAAWGYFLVTFDFNLNGVSILPRFMGYLLLLSAVGKLSAVRRDLALLRPLCALLAGWSGVDWLLSWWGGDVDGHIPFLDLVAAAVTLYFHFQFLTDMAVLAEWYKPEESNLDRRILRRRTAYILLVTAMTLVSNLLPPDLLGWASPLVGALAVAAGLTALCVMTDLFHLRGCLPQPLP